MVVEEVLILVEEVVAVVVKKMTVEEEVTVVVKDSCYLLLFSNSCLSFNLLNLSLITKSTPGGPGAFYLSSLAISFFPMSSSFNKETTTGFSASNVEISSETSSTGFYLLRTFLLIGSSFCLKLALLIRSLVTS